MNCYSGSKPCLYIWLHYANMESFTHLLLQRKHFSKWNPLDTKCKKGNEYMIRAANRPIADATPNDFTLQLTEQTSANSLYPP